MKGPALLRTLAIAAVLLVLGWLVYHTRWVEIEVPDAVHGQAAADELYALRRIVEGAGSTLETRTTLDPLPPANATLLLDSSFWNIFPERDARLRAWVENGGHLVLQMSRSANGTNDLRWVPLTFAPPPARKPARQAKTPAAAASSADDENAQGDAAEEAAPAAARPPSAPIGGGRNVARLLEARTAEHNCADFEETDATTAPAFEPGRIYRGCTYAGTISTLNHVAPTWLLKGKPGTLAMRVQVGRGTVTGVSPSLLRNNRGLLRGDNGLIAGAVLQAAPGRAIWIVGDEAREPLAGWLWHEARTPLLLTGVAIALALWRLMVRFGPREAPPPQARRSMGEQVRGTGQFIAGTDSRALHAATRRAFEDVARTRVEDWARREDADRIAALADSIAPTQTLDKAALQACLNIGGGATPTQILTAIAVLEQARRALLRAPASPFAH